MRFLKRASGNAEEERLPAFLPTSCVGEACPNFSGTPCENPEMEWMVAEGPKEGEGTIPPKRSETRYITYGQRCLAGVAPELVAQKIVVLKPETVSIGRLVAEAGVYGDMPVEIVQGEETARIETIAASTETRTLFA